MTISASSLFAAGAAGASAGFSSAISGFATSAAAAAGAGVGSGLGAGLGAGFGSGLGSADGGIWRAEGGGGAEPASDVGPKDGYDEIDWSTSAQLIWGTDLMREMGAILGLAVGYVVKYNLDRRYVFPDSRLRAAS